MKLLDKKDKKIIKLINADWNQGLTEMGRKLGLSHTAVRSRLQRLTRDLMKINCTVNIDKLGLKLFLICLEARFKNKVVSHVKNCPKIINYYDTFGEYNRVLLAVAGNTDTMESMIEQCFSFNFTDITKYTVIPLTNSPVMYQPVRFYLDDEKTGLKCDFKTDCPHCESFKENRCVGCPLHPGYKGLL